MELNASEAEIERMNKIAAKARAQLAETIITAANALHGHHSIVLAVQKEADRLNELGYTSTSRRMFEAAKKLEALFLAIGDLD